jgi:subfamily B ATP-binding cassette protein MsbA
VKAKVWADARQLIDAHRGKLALGLALLLASRIASLVLPATSKYLIDDVIGKGRQNLLPVLVGAAIIAAMIQAACAFTLAHLLGIAAHRSITEMRKGLEQHVLRLPLTYFDSTKSGMLMSQIMSDPEGIRNLVGTGLAQLAGGAITSGLALMVLLYLHWPLTLLTIALLAVYATVMLYALKRTRQLHRQRSEITGQVFGRLQESLGGIRVVKSFASERREDLAFARGVHRNLRVVVQTITAVSGATAVANVGAGILGGTIMLVGSRSVFAGTMTLGDFVMYVFFTGLLVEPMRSVASGGTQLTEAFAGLDRVREVMAVEGELADDDARRPIGRVHGDVSFEDVSFEYKPGIPVVRHVTFAARAQTTTALVGSSGAGKSTMLALLATFNQPTAGRILVDGHDLSTVRLRDYRPQLGIVLQENFMFDGTIAENLRYGRKDATEAEMREAARISHVDEFVEPLAEQYDTVIGERGIKLSGGQRQRIAIGRAILADPCILILDEATSSLDSESEAKIRDALRALRRGRTTFVIAHRLSTIRTADQILVLEAGAIVERGTHAELLRANGRYKQLYDRQYSVESDQFINPGEDFLPVPEPVAEASAGGSRDEI